MIDLVKGKITSRIGLDRDCEIFTSDDDLYVWTAHEHQRENVSCVLLMNLTVS